MGHNFGDAFGDRSGATQEDNSPVYSKDNSSVRMPGEEATPSGRTATSGLERNPTSVPIGTPTPARNSGSGAGSGPSAAMAMHNATSPAVL